VGSWAGGAVDQWLERTPMTPGVVSSNSAGAMWTLWWQTPCAFVFIGFSHFLPLSSFHQSSIPSLSIPA